LNIHHTHKADIRILTIISEIVMNNLAAVQVQR